MHSESLGALKDTIRIFVPVALLVAAVIMGIAYGAEAAQRETVATAALHHCLEVTQNSEVCAAAYLNAR